MLLCLEYVFKSTISLAAHNCRVIQALTLLSLNVAAVFLHPVFLMFSPPLSAAIIYLWILTFLEHYSALCSDADDVFVPRPGHTRPDFCRVFSTQVLASTSAGRHSAVLCRKVFILNSSNIFITSLRFRTNSLSGCTSEPLSGYLCSCKAQLQSAGLNYFCVHIHQAEIARVNSCEGLQQLCRITDVKGTAGPVRKHPGWMVDDPRLAKCLGSVLP